MRKRKSGESSERSEGGEGFVEKTRPKETLTCQACLADFPKGSLEVTGIGTFDCPKCGERSVHPWDKGPNAAKPSDLENPTLASMNDPKHNPAATNVVTRSKKDREDPGNAPATCWATVTVVWGEEKIQLRPFNVCTIGPFSLTEPVRIHESFDEAFERATTMLNKFAAKARRQKLDEYKRILEEIEG